ncbi:MAG: hypothetical protein WCS91_04225 [Bacilli bacterium]
MEKSTRDIPSFRFFQYMSFQTKVAKSYDNPRYPLETAQFWINIEPTSWLHVSNIRYEIGNEVVDVSSSQKSGNTGFQYCTIDGGTCQTENLEHGSRFYGWLQKRQGVRYYPIP